jgi:hypothetical protein
MKYTQNQGKEFAQETYERLKKFDADAIAKWICCINQPRLASLMFLGERNFTHDAWEEIKKHLKGYEAEVREGKEDSLIPQSLEKCLNESKWYQDWCLNGELPNDFMPKRIFSLSELELRWMYKSSATYFEGLRFISTKGREARVVHSPEFLMELSSIWNYKYELAVRKSKKKNKQFPFLESWVYEPFEIPTELSQEAKLLVEQYSSRQVKDMLGYVGEQTEIARKLTEYIIEQRLAHKLK